MYIKGSKYSYLTTALYDKMKADIFIYYVKKWTKNVAPKWCKWFTLVSFSLEWRLVGPAGGGGEAKGGSRLETASNPWKDRALP